MGSLISELKLGSQTHNGDGMEISKQSRKDTKMNSNPNQMHAQMPLLLAEIVLASAKNVNRLRAVLGQLAQCAADNFADKQAAYYAHHCYAALLACKANQPTGNSAH